MYIKIFNETNTWESNDIFKYMVTSNPDEYIELKFENKISIEDKADVVGTILQFKGTTTSIVVDNGNITISIDIKDVEYSLKEYGSVVIKGENIKW